MVSVGLSSVFSYRWKEQVGPNLTCLSLLSSLSLFIFLFHQRLSLNDRVPVKVVLDVVGSEHASHMEVSQRQSVLLLLLAQLAKVA